jgi:hypothetical protein
MSYVVFGLGSSVRLLTTYLYFQIQSLVQSHNVLHQKISQFFCRCVIGKKQEDVSCVMRRGCVWCIKIYRSVFSLLSQHYRKLVQVLDYRRIIPLLEEWSESMVHNTGCSPDVLFFSNGKPWKVAKPGNGDAADALIRAAGGDQVNLIQQAFTMVIMVLLVPKYSISCKQMGFVTASLVHCVGMMPWYFKNPPAKVQHILQADGICYSFTCPLRRHDAMVLQESSMRTMLSVLYVNNNHNRPAKSVTDKAYGRTQLL